MDVELRKRWKTTEVLLERAYSALPSAGPGGSAAFEVAIKEFRDCLGHNELELALDALCAAADLVAAPGGAWRDLERAAEVMGLNGRLPELRRKFLIAASRVAGNSATKNQNVDDG